MEPSSDAGFFFLQASIVKMPGEQYNRGKFRNPFLGRGLLEMSQKVREIVTIVFGFISGANAIYQLLFRQDIALFIVNTIVVGIAFYSWLNRDNPEQLKKMNRGGVVILIWIVAFIVFGVIMNHFGYEQWESWKKSVVKFTFIFGLVTVVNRYIKK